MARDTQTIAAGDVVNDVVGQHPAALPVLNRYGLDTCCGGALSLDEAARHHDLDLAALLADLNAAAGRAEGG
jgi:regulator of cell morphogenesis and NO signaling